MIDACVCVFKKNENTFHLFLECRIIHDAVKYLIPNEFWDRKRIITKIKKKNFEKQRKQMT